MDLLLFGATALLETLCLKAAVVPDATSRRDEPGYGFHQLLVLTFMQYMSLKIYRIFIYPTGSRLSANFPVPV